MTNLSENLDRLTAPGELQEKLEGGALRCYACAHRCLIKPGRRGICQVRFNQEGELRVPWGYVAALQVDPIEKKPFSHLMPGTDALTFGMLGCDFHCSYCFPADTMVITNHGPVQISRVFDSAENKMKQPDVEIAYPEGWQAVTQHGEFKPVRAVFKHPYQGKLLVIQPYYLPELRCTPDHKVYATLHADQEPSAIPAHALTKKHYLVIPRNHSFSSEQVIDVEKLLGCHDITYHVRWSLTEEQRQTISTATLNGQTSREIGQAMGKSASYVRHVRSKLAQNKVHDMKTSGPVIENGQLRFPNEHRPGVPLFVSLDEKFARLLGLYCAEGSVVSSKNRPNSLTVNFSFSLIEKELEEDVIKLLADCLGVTGRIITRQTSRSVTFSKASVALLFQTLCGKLASGKRIPEMIYQSSGSVAKVFLDAYVAGDGHRYTNGKVSITTISEDMAYGVAWLALKLGYMPSLYKTGFEKTGFIQGRQVNRAPYQYSVVWYEGNPEIERKFFETDDYYLIPLRSISEVDFDGSVFNMEVEEIHNYMAGMLLVSNCQNWVTSQVGRDEDANHSIDNIIRISPEQITQLAQQSGAGVVVSSYNEPLITSEWAVAVFRRAKEAGLRCAFVSNGNATPEVLAYLRPYLSGYKVDLKSMQDKQYRKLGGVLNNVLDTIRSAHDLGLWVEVVTLVIPGFNDDPAELWDAARYLRSVSADIPWHVTAFHPDYQMDADHTPPETLRTAAEIGQEAGLHYVYAGNLPGRVGTYEDTFCPNCSTRVVQRRGYTVLDYQITSDGKCPTCHTPIAGVWPEKPESVRTGGVGIPRRIHF